MGDSMALASWFNSVRLATTTNVTLSGLGTDVDGVTLGTGDRILVKDQNTPSDNGIYFAATGSWTRATDFGTGTSSATPEATIRVSEGALNAHTEWSLVTQGTINVGTTALTFAQQLHVAVADDVARSGGPDTAINRVEGIRGRM